MNSVWIGTSGWTYDGWRGPFYPEDVPKRRWLEWYAGQFGSKEVNGSFYRTPSLEAVRGWREQTPREFVFAWKASKFITHWKRLSKKSVNSIELMETRLKALGRKAGPVLFQLPARFKADRERPTSFLKLLPKRYRYAFEFRDESWYDDAILHVLKDRNAALCISDHVDAPSPWQVTADFVYVRGHGPTGQYKDRYPSPTPKKWAATMARWKRHKLDVYCYFDNDQKSAAPMDARRLIDLLGGKRGSPLKRISRKGAKAQSAR
jgi:uncharacterized protein YecE (DUF72 family)